MSSARLRVTLAEMVARAFDQALPEEAEAALGPVTHDEAIGFDHAVVENRNVGAG